MCRHVEAGTAERQQLVPGRPEAHTRVSASLQISLDEKHRPTATADLESLPSQEQCVHRAYRVPSRAAVLVQDPRRATGWIAPL